MSNSFPNSPTPHDPNPDEAYTPTPARPQRSRSRDEDEIPVAGPKLGSLAQKARGQKLKQARIILFIIGGLTMIAQVISLFVSLNEGVDPLLAVAIHGLFILVGGLFILFGALIYLFPVPITILSLVLYVLVSLLDIGIAAMTEPARMGAGLIWKIIFTIALASSIKAAVAYEKERRAEEDYEYDG